MKRIVAWFVVLAVIAGMGVPALANIGIMPMNINVSRFVTELTFDGTTANCEGLVQGLSGTTNVTATYTLLRKEVSGAYTTVKTWSNQSVSGTTLRFFETYTVTKGYTYRLTCSAKVTRNGTTETLNNWVEAKA
ncbi:MAG: hypothetical protein FWG36_10895 [Oscillospiraceae bacterium]|nr:hypothetical protein [Oscillospiraceae bacterium]